MAGLLVLHILPSLSLLADPEQGNGRAGAAVMVPA